MHCIISAERNDRATVQNLIVCRLLSVHSKTKDTGVTIVDFLDMNGFVRLAFVVWSD